MKSYVCSALSRRSTAAQLSPVALDRIHFLSLSLSQVRAPVCGGSHDFWEKSLRPLSFVYLFPSTGVLVFCCCLKVAFSLINRHFLLRLRKSLVEIAAASSVEFRPVY